MKTLLLLCLAMLIFPKFSISDIVIVPVDRPTIMQGIEAASFSDTVLVLPGTYQEQLTFDGKAIVVGSLFLTTGDTSYISQTIIVPPVTGGAVVLFESGETKASILSGLKIMNGTGKKVNGQYKGGAVFCTDASPTLDHLWITKNVPGGFNSLGGGIFLFNSQSRISDCRLDSNQCSFGGGIYAYSSDVTILNCLFNGNFALTGGGGVYFYECSHGLIQGCTFTGNQSMYGGAIGSYGSQPVIDRSTCYHNLGGQSGSLDVTSSSTVKIINSIFWQNTFNPESYTEIGFGTGFNILMVAYSDIYGGDTAIHINNGLLNWMEGNISEYPAFTDTSCMDLSLGIYSPCIDAGTSFYIYNGDTIVNISEYNGAHPDMGANESEWAVYVEDHQQLVFVIQEFNGEKQIFLSPETSCHIKLNVYDMLGNLTETLFDSDASAGKFTLTWNTADYRSGCYIITLNDGKRQMAKKIVINI